MISDIVNWIWTIRLLALLLVLYPAILWSNKPLLVCLTKETNTKLVKNCIGNEFSLGGTVPDDKDQTSHYLHIYCNLIFAFVLQALPLVIWESIFQAEDKKLASLLNGISKNAIGTDEGVTQMCSLIRRGSYYRFWKKKRVSRGYLVLKFVYFAVSVCQLMIANSWEGCTLYEGIVMMTFLGDRETLDRFFPSSAVCEYPVFKHTSCVLKANYTASIMFRIICGLYLVLSVFNGLAFFDRLRRFFSRTYRDHSIDYWLNGLKDTTEPEEFERQKTVFKEQFLGEDGIFFLEYASNVDNLAAGVICRCLFLQTSQDMV